MSQIDEALKSLKEDNYKTSNKQFGRTTHIGETPSIPAEKVDDVGVELKKPEGEEKGSMEEALIMLEDSDWPNAARMGASAYTSGYMSVGVGTSVRFKGYGGQVEKGVVVSRDKDMFWIRRADGTQIKVGYGNIKVSESVGSVIGNVDVEDHNDVTEDADNRDCALTSEDMPNSCDMEEEAKVDDVGVELKKPDGEKCGSMEEALAMLKEEENAASLLGGEPIVDQSKGAEKVDDVDFELKDPDGKAMSEANARLDREIATATRCFNTLASISKYGKWKENKGTAQSARETASELDSALHAIALELGSKGWADSKHEAENDCSLLGGEPIVDQSTGAEMVDDVGVELKDPDGEEKGTMSEALHLLKEDLESDIEKDLKAKGVTAQARCFPGYKNSIVNIYIQSKAEADKVFTYLSAHKDPCYFAVTAGPSTRVSGGMVVGAKVKN